ncbi:MAG: exodeoxyribonuclease V subunit alpha [Deltaproteobacteria bacterium]|nr:exodeoxyribonuclease V subunit alpha [Deltaproteobacteria bacterium]
MKPGIEILHREGALSDLDLHFARTMGELAGESRPLVLLGAAAASRFTGEGHVCAPLKQLAGAPIRTSRGGDIEGLFWPDEELWLVELMSSSLVGDGSRPTPLVLEDDRLYLTRYWRYEQRLAALLNERAGLADKSKLAIISGGPGTGKTSTVVRILAALIEQSRPDHPLPRVLMMAPTGKAAARLAESIRNAKAATGPGALTCAQQIKEDIPEEATTIHRALGFRPDRPTRFRHDRENPLSADMVVVDEASMIDLALLTKLLDAVPANARLVLLGDRDQIASVEAGAVFGDICEAGPKENIVHLTHSYRFETSSGIGNLAQAINTGGVDDALLSLTQGTLEGVDFIEIQNRVEVRRTIEPFVLENYVPCFEAGTPSERLGLFNNFRILCAHREGLFGAAGLNRLVEEILREADYLPPFANWYDGRPILITHNDHQLGLFNGDTGLVCRAGPGSRELTAAFDVGADGPRTISLSRLPSCETAFAMTVHKSQGSEFDHVAVVLPENPSPVITRELLYTAVTRAKKHVTLIGPRHVIAHAIKTRVERISGLKQLLRP